MTSLTLSPPNATIFACASGTGGAIAIIRLSGSATRDILGSICDGGVPQVRRASLRKLVHCGDTLDEALVLFFAGPHSYTGEDGAELHVHAGPAVISAVSEALVALGARPAEAGEFTRRAVQNGRLDIIQAEAIADLINAESDLQRRQALAQSEGRLSQLYMDWSERLMRLRARQEAQIDFPDDLSDEEAQADVLSHIEKLLAEMRRHLSDRRGEVVRRGMTVVIAGAPNVGKSSLLNLLAGYDAAIVTARAGTTRDVVAVDWIFEGVKIRLLDTAGLRETEDEIEAEGIRRALFHVKHADIVIHLFHGEPPESLSPNEVMVYSKADLGGALDGMLAVSTATEAGIEALTAFLADRVAALRPDGNVPLTRARHRAGIEDACKYLEEAQQCPLPELRGESLRLAGQALGRITGQIDVESLLTVIFGAFCIGK